MPRAARGLSLAQLVGVARRYRKARTKEQKQALAQGLGLADRKHPLCVLYNLASYASRA